ncbi:MAG: glycosyltransferase, partial [Nitrososphaerota archaeon]|nr:glycosyltransferase [Nitrososphaerota archaeon]
YDKFKRLNIKLVYVRNYKEPSLTIARNIGVSIAKGDIILFLDNDVVLHSDYVEKILEVFKENRNALGACGWINLEIETRGHIYTRRHHIINTWRMIFCLSHFKHSEKEKYKLFEYPLVLRRVTPCESLTGSNMAFKRDVFKESHFDENLKKYAYMEDKLFCYPVQKKYPNSLYITPHAKCIHKVSEEGRMEASFSEHPFSRACRKYVLTKLFGIKGLLIFGWQTLGLLTLSTSRRIWRLIKLKKTL